MTRQEIDCEQALKRIAEYIDHELGERERETLQQHLHTCKSCFSRAEFERRLKEEVGALCEEEAPSQLGERVKGLLRSF